MEWVTSQTRYSKVAWILVLVLSSIFGFQVVNPSNKVGVSPDCQCPECHCVDGEAN